MGATAQFSSSILAANSSHTLTYGVDYYETSNESVRDGGTKDSLGNPVFEFSPLPTRDFPKTDVENIAFYIQDEIELLDGKLLLLQVSGMTEMKLPHLLILYICSETRRSQTG